MQNVSSQRGARLPRFRPDPSKLKKSGQVADKTFTSRDVARIAHCSLRQLQWWDERAILPVRHVGHSRRYRANEVLVISLVSEFRRKGLSLQAIRRNLRKLQKHVEDWVTEGRAGAGPLYVAVACSGPKYARVGAIVAVTDSQDALLETITLHSGSVVLATVSSDILREG